MLGFKPDWERSSSRGSSPVTTRLADFSHRLSLEESQQNSETVLFPELVHCLIQQRGQLLPRGVGVCGLNFHLCRLSFALPAPAFGPQNVGGRKARRPIE